MYTSDLDSDAHASSGNHSSAMDEKAALSEAYGFDYETSPSAGTKSGSDSFSKKKNSSFLSLPIFSFAFKANGQQPPFSKHSSSFSKNKNAKNITVWVIAVIMFLVISYPIYSFIDTSYNGSSLSDATDTSILTTDPLIYPDLETLFKSKNSGSGANRQASKKSPTDHTFDLSDKEMPAAAKGKRPNAVPGSMQNSGNDKNSNSDNLHDDELKKTGPKSSNSEFHNRNAILGSFKFHSPSKDNSFWGFGKNSASSKKSPELVIVTGINPEKYSVEYLEKIIENRKKYATRWGFGLYIRLVTDYREEYEISTTKSSSWAKLPILRSAIQVFPDAKHFWNLDSNALIQDMDSNIVTDLLEPSALSEKIERNRPILRFNSIIKTYKHMSPNNCRLILAPDEVGVSTSSFILANLDRDLTIDFASAGNNRYNVRKYKGAQHGIFAKSLLEYWNDPSSRSYRQYTKNEASALNHMLQWHATFLSRAAVVNGRELMSYSEETVANLLGLRGSNLQVANQLPKVEGEMSIDDYEKDGLVFHLKAAEKRGRVVVLGSCASGSSITCLKELSKYNNVQSKKDASKGDAAQKDKMIGNDQQKQQQAQAHEAQAQAQAQAEKNANPGQQGGFDGSNKNAADQIEAQIAADIANKKAASNDPKAQVKEDIEKAKAALRAKEEQKGSQQPIGPAAAAAAVKKEDSVAAAAVAAVQKDIAAKKAQANAKNEDPDTKKADKEAAIAAMVQNDIAAKKAQGQLEAAIAAAPKTKEPAAVEKEDPAAAAAAADAVQKDIAGSNTQEPEAAKVQGQQQAPVKQGPVAEDQNVVKQEAAQAQPIADAQQQQTKQA